MSSKKINFNNTNIKISAGFLKQVPKDLPHVVFSGRSNVGKSTLINKLTNQNKLARTSSSPGKTVTLNFFDADKTFYLVDLPGYGYAKRSETERKKWSDLVEGYFRNYSEHIKLVVQLVDLKVGPTEDDLNMLDYMDNYGLDYVIIATKADKLNKTNKEKNLSELKSDNPDHEVIAFSSLSGEGVSEARGYISGIIRGL